jgi:pantoate--beta-alanine ligase
MGYLHEGHRSLVRAARAQCDFLVVSIFVNPTQFAPSEDLEQYPRDMDRDSLLCRQEDVDLLFCPPAESMYAPDHSTHVSEEALSTGLCGTSRPTHFRGVTTVVAKLFNIVQPDMAVFGQKDGQQARVIKRMVRDLNFPVEIVVAPTVREEDGLAMSSRNAYLGAEERSRAPHIYGALRSARTLCSQGETRVEALEAEVRRLLSENVGGTVDYVAFVDDETLVPVEHIERKTLVALAVRVGSTRLIDNIVLSPP